MNFLAEENVLHFLDIQKPEEYSHVHEPKQQDGKTLESFLLLLSFFYYTQDAYLCTYSNEVQEY
jgi:hypothetical protein